MANSPVRRSKFTTVDVDVVHSNVGQEIIEITADKLRLILNDNIQLMAARNEWHTPLSILVTITLVLITTNFKSVLGLSADTWAAIFIISAGLNALWLLKSLFSLRKSISVEDILNAAKNKT